MNVIFCVTMYFLFMTSVEAQTTNNNTNLPVASYSAPFKGDDFIEINAEGLHKFGYSLDIHESSFVKARMKKDFGFGEESEPIPVAKYELCKFEVNNINYKNFIYEIVSIAANNPDLLDKILYNMKEKNYFLEVFINNIIEKDSKQFQTDIFRVTTTGSAVTAVYNPNLSSYDLEPKEEISKKMKIMYYAYRKSNKAILDSLQCLVIGDLKYNKADDDSSFFLNKIAKIMSSGVASEIRPNHSRLIFYLMPYYDDIDKNKLDIFYKTDSNNKWNNYPVVGIDYYCAHLFATFNNLRLPSEIEYEMAGKYRREKLLKFRIVRFWRVLQIWKYGKTVTTFVKADFPCGYQMKNYSNIEMPILNANYSESSNKNSDFFVEVNNNMFKQNGFYHLAGNVCEWMLNDYFNPYFSDKAFSQFTLIMNNENTVDINKPENIYDYLTKIRIVRGGHYHSHMVHLRIQSRIKSQATNRSARIGFRCAID